MRDGVVSLDRLAEAVRMLDPDVLALQEVDRDQPRPHRADLTAVAGEAMGAVPLRFVAALSGTPRVTWIAAGEDDVPGTGASTSWFAGLWGRHSQWRPRAPATGH